MNDLEPAVVQLARENRSLEKRIVELQGALSAQDEREQIAGAACGVPRAEHGCDWPDAMAEKVLGLRSRLSQLEGERDRLAALVEAHRQDSLDMDDMIAERDRLREALSKADDAIVAGQACRSEGEFARWMHDAQAARPHADLRAREDAAERPAPPTFADGQEAAHALERDLSDHRPGIKWDHATRGVIVQHLCRFIERHAERPAPAVPPAQACTCKDTEPCLEDYGRQRGWSEPQLARCYYCKRKTQPPVPPGGLDALARTTAERAHNLTEPLRLQRLYRLILAALQQAQREP